MQYKARKVPRNQEARIHYIKIIIIIIKKKQANKAQVPPLNALSFLH